MSALRRAPPLRDRRPRPGLSQPAPGPSSRTRSPRAAAPATRRRGTAPAGVRRLHLSPPAIQRWVGVAVGAALLLAVAALLASWLGAAAGVLSTLALGCCALAWDAARRLERARTAAWPPEEDSVLTAQWPSRLATDDSLWARLADAVGAPGRDGTTGLPSAACRTGRGLTGEGPRVLH